MGVKHWKLDQYGSHTCINCTYYFVVVGFNGTIVVHGTTYFLNILSPVHPVIISFKLKVRYLPARLDQPQSNTIGKALKITSTAVGFFKFFIFDLEYLKRVQMSRFKHPIPLILLLLRQCSTLADFFFK
jgi:hypothetical protein